MSRPPFPPPASNDWRAPARSAALVARGPRLRRWIPVIPIALAAIVAGVLTVAGSGTTDRWTAERASPASARDARAATLPTIGAATVDLPRIEPLPLPTAPVPASPSTSSATTTGPSAPGAPAASTATITDSTVPTRACTANALVGALFEADTAALTEAARAVVRTLAIDAARSSGEIHVIGHTDRRWTPYPGGNDALSVDRAESVKRELIADGIAPDRVGTAGKGASEPVAPGDSESAYSQNRRVVVIGMCP